MSKSLSFTRSYRERPVNRLIILSIISILLMVLDNRYAAVRQLKAYLAIALQPLQWLADQPVALYRLRQYIPAITANTHSGKSKAANRKYASEHRHPAKTTYSSFSWQN